MRIHFERTGGLAGTRVSCEISSEALPPDDRQRLTQLVAESGFFETTGSVEDTDGADRFEYTLAIDAGVRAHALRIGEANVPARLQPLIRWLTKIAQRSRR